MLEPEIFTATRKVGDWFAVFVGRSVVAGLVACEMCAKHWSGNGGGLLVQIGGGVFVLPFRWGVGCVYGPA